MADKTYNLEAALEQLDRIKQTNGSRPWRLCVRKFNPGGLTAHQTVEVEGLYAGFDWEAGKVVITPARPMTELSPEDVDAIRKSVKDGQSWHAYQGQKRLRDRIAGLEEALRRAEQALVKAHEIVCEYEERSSASEAAGVVAADLEAVRADLAGVPVPAPGHENMRDDKPASSWRDDALEQAALIVERYQADPWIARDIRAMKSPGGVRAALHQTDGPPASDAHEREPAELAVLLPGWTIRPAQEGEILVVGPNGNGTHVADRGSLSARLLHSLAKALLAVQGGPTLTSPRA